MRGGYLQGIDAQGRSKPISPEHGDFIETQVIDPNLRLCPPPENRRFWSYDDYKKYISTQLEWFQDSETVAREGNTINEFRAKETVYWQDFFAAATKQAPRKSTTSFEFEYTFERSEDGRAKMLEWFHKLEGTNDLPLVLVNVLGDHPQNSARKWFYLPLAEQKQEFINFCKKLMLTKSNALVVLQIQCLDATLKSTTVLNMAQSFESSRLTESSNAAEDF